MRQILDIFKLLKTMINWQMIVWLYLIIPNERVLHLGIKKYDIKKEVRSLQSYLFFINLISQFYFTSSNVLPIDNQILV